MPALAAATQQQIVPRNYQPLRIALLGYRSNPYSGGQGVYLKYVSRALAQMGHQVHVISGEPYPELDDGIELIKLPGLNLYAQPRPLRALRWRHLLRPTDFFEWVSMMSGGFPEPYTFGRRVHRYLSEHRSRYDVVHDNQCLAYGVLQLQSQGVPLVTTIHHPITFDLDIALANTDSWGLRLLIKRWHRFLRMQTKVARRLHHVITVSECSKRDICQSFGVAPERVHVIRNGVDSQEFAPRPEISREPRLLITTASADQPLKGTQHLIPAFARLREEFSDLRLTFIGKPKPEGTTAQLIEQYQLGEHIDFLHGVSSQEIVELYARASIAIVPSEYEGFGLPAAEAMACGVPVVSTDGGALPEVVGEAGVIVPKADPAALAEAVAGLLRDRARAERLGAAGRVRVQQEFSWSDVACELTSHYQAIIGT